MIILFGSIPLILLFGKELIKSFFNINNEKYFDLILVTIPFVFSSVIVIINFLLLFIKNQNNKLKNIIYENNEIINSYNKIVTKAEINYNNFMNTVFSMILILDRLKIKPLFNSMIICWENNIKNVFDLSNEENFRSFIRNSITELIKIYRTDNSYDIELEYISGLKTNLHKYENISLEERIFIFKLRKMIKFTKEEKKIIHSYLDMYSNGDIYNLACKEYIDAIINYRECFENEIRNKEINNKKLFTLLYCLINSTFSFCEKIIYEVYLIDNFINIITNNVNKYYNTNKINKALNELIKFEEIRTPEFLNKYIDKNSFYKFFNINIDEI